jgi:hypothetical protein
MIDSLNTDSEGAIAPFVLLKHAPDPGDSNRLAIGIQAFAVSSATRFCNNY